MNHSYPVKSIKQIGGLHWVFVLDLKNEDEFLRPKTTYIKCNKNNDIKKDY